MQLEYKIKYAALALFILTAIFSIGHHDSDEYFQILELAQYKLGYIQAADLPWEFHEKMRPSLQPWLAYLAIKFLHFIKLTNPFIIITIIRTLSAILAWLVISKLNKLIGSKYFSDKKWLNLFKISSYFLWFVPYLNVRFSSENYAQIFLLSGLYFLIKDSKSYRNLFITGGLLGLSVLFRYQLGITIVGILLWIIYNRTTPLKKLMAAFLSFLLVVFTGVFLDYLFYNEFVLTSVNYLKINLIEGRVSNFGTSPWWYYIVTFLGVAVPPISIILLASFLMGAKKLKNDLFTWAIIPFIIIHFFIGHKEIRFLFPISYIFIFISMYGLMDYFRNRPIKKYHRRWFRVSVGINAVLLLFMMFRPANEMVANYRYLYNNLNLGKSTIISIEKDNYKLMAGLKSTFYAPRSYISDHINSPDELHAYLVDNQIDSCFLVYNKFNFTEEIENYTIQKVYSVYPGWIKNINWIDWQKALHTHSIFLITENQ